ncbi:MAG: MaoC family dehydratase [Deltaproteobacteria bacterium]|nr:MaoC family dehydratase [Deltaproteobacteria bacterium]
MRVPKVSHGRFFEDFGIGQHLVHALPRTLHGGDISTYMALTGDRHPLASSTELARSLGFNREVIPDLLVFHVVFGKSVADISHNAQANLGYADVRFLRPVYPGDTLVAESDVIGLREVSSGEAGVVYVRTRGVNQKGQEVLSFVRWVLVPKRDKTKAIGVNNAPQLPSVVTPERLPIPESMNLQRYNDLAWAFGTDVRWDDYEQGERLDHPDAMTIEEADHVQATRLYHNSAQVHFDAKTMAESRAGRRIVYGGHVISVAMALAQNGLGAMLRIAAWNGGAHVAMTFAGDTLRAFTEVVEKAELGTRKDVGALRLRLCAVKNVGAGELANVAPLLSGTKEPRIVLELDYWALLPRR